MYICLLRQISENLGSREQKGRNAIGVELDLGDYLHTSK
jgi:hypothetical protein